MELLFATLTVVSVTMLGAASPGPDTALILKNALLGSRKSAFATVFGIITGVVIYVAVAIAGLGIIMESGFVYAIVQLLGALYLLYLGITLLRVRKEARGNDTNRVHGDSTWHAYVEGLTTNILNPKFVLFLIALFSQVIHPEWPVATKLFLGILVPLTALCVFLLVVYAITHVRFKDAILATRTLIERLMGGVLIALAAKVFMSIGR